MNKKINNENSGSNNTTTKKLKVQDTGEYIRNNATLQIEINKGKVDIDRNVFKKSKEEKEELKKAKSAHKGLVTKFTNSI
jgi:hypothetical protein